MNHKKLLRYYYLDFFNFNLYHSNPEIPAPKTFGAGILGPLYEKDYMKITIKITQSNDSRCLGFKS
jgi:hypothetical protein